MPFVKLDCGILNSTLWFNREQREIFLTALLMAVPREMVDPVPQYRVNQIELTGFVAPPGWYGFVEAAGPGIVNRALVAQDSGYAALEALGEPDKESRSKAFEGRRLIRVDGGYLVLNYMAYRERDYGNAERCKRYREKLKTRPTPMSTVTTSHVNMHADAEAYINPKSAPGPGGRRRAIHESQNGVPNPKTLPGGVVLTPADLRRLRPEILPGEPRKFPEAKI